MDIFQIQNKYFKAIELRISKENDLNSFIQEWLNGNKDILSFQVEETINNKLLELDRIKKEESRLWLMYQESILKDKKVSITIEEKQNILEIIKSKLIRKEITFKDASKLLIKLNLNLLTSQEEQKSKKI